MRTGLWRDRREAAVDIALAAAFALLTMPVYLTDLVAPQPAGLWWYLGTEMPFALLLLVRRRAPLIGLGALTVVAWASWAVVVTVVQPATEPMAHGVDFVPLTAVPVVYSAAVYAGRRWVAWLLVGLLALLATAPWELVRNGLGALSGVAAGLVFTAVPALFGLYVGARRRLLRNLADRAERAEREQVLVAAQARAADRAQLAAEMHDVVTHKVSLIVLQAGALRITALDDDTRRVAEELRTVGCQALEELRDLVGVLRTDPGADGDPEDGSERASLPDLAGLVAASDAAGVPVRLVETGDPRLASPVVGRTAYRIVREALTNVHKHAPGATTRVDVTYAADGVALTVHNALAPQPPDRDLRASGSGTGLDVLRRRVELVHGTLRAEPGVDGGFRVDAELPAYVPTSVGARDGI